MPKQKQLLKEFSAHLLAVSPTAHWLERMDLAAPVLEPVLDFKDGRVHFGNTLGVGIIWREDAVSRVSV